MKLCLLRSLKSPEFKTRTLKCEGCGTQIQNQKQDEVKNKSKSQLKTNQNRIIIDKTRTTQLLEPAPLEAKGAAPRAAFLLIFQLRACY